MATTSAAEGTRPVTVRRALPLRAVHVHGHSIRVDRPEAALAPRAELGRPLDLEAETHETLVDLVDERVVELEPDAHPRLRQALDALELDQLELGVVAHVQQRAP